MQTKFSELYKLKNAANILEKSCDVFKEKIFATIDNSLVQLKRNIQIEREKCCTTLEQQVSNLLNSLEGIKLQLGDDYNVRDLERMKKEMIFLQHHIAKCKFELENQLSCLLEEETALSDEVKVYEKLLVETSSHDVTSMPAKASTVTTTKHSKEDSKRRQQEEDPDFVWGREEHLKYLKAKQIHRDFDEMCRVLMALIPGLTVEDISQHETLHCSSLIKEDILNDEMNNKKAPSGEGSSKAGKNRKHDEMIKEKLAAWKEEKKDKAIMEQHLHQLLEIKRMNEALYKRLLNEQTKEKIQKWKREKAQVAAAMELKRIEDKQKQKQAKILRANYMIKQYREQDMEIVRKKLDQKVKQPTAKPLQRIQQTRRNVERVFKPTEQWLSRTKINNASNERLISDIHHVNKLKVPAWRKSK